MRGRENNDHDDGSNDDENNNNNNNQSADRSNPLVNRFRCLNIADGIVRPFNAGPRHGRQGHQGRQGPQGHQGHASAANRKTMESKLEVRLVSLYGLVGLAAISRHLGPAFRAILLDDPQRVPRVAMAVGVDRRVFMMNQPRVLEDEGYSSSTEDVG